jgi:hypothetical protein
VKNWQYKTCFASCLLVLASVAAPSFARQTDSLQLASLRTEDGAAPVPKHKAKKVWTEDTIAGVRTPADKYLDGKEAAKDSSNNSVGGDSSVAESKGIGAPPVVLQIPQNVEETQKAIDQRKDLANNLHNVLSNAQERLETETDPMVRATLLEKAKLLNEDLNTTNSEIKALKRALDDYKNGKTPAQPKTEGQTNAPEAAKPAEQTPASSTPQ